MTHVWILAGKEIRDGMRNRWVIVVTLLMAGLALIMAALGSAPIGTTKVSALSITIVSLSSLSILFIPLIALLLSFDAIVGESERGTLMLLLAYPVKKWQVIVGKFTGQLMLLSIAIVIGFGSALIAIAIKNETGMSAQSWHGVIRLIGSSILLGATFIAIGALISTSVRERGTAAGIAVATWLALVLIYDLGLLGLLAADAGQTLSTTLVTGLLIANPTDAYRMFNLAGNEELSALSGMAGLNAGHQVPGGALIVVLFMWSVLPLATACLVLQRRSL